MKRTIDDLILTLADKRIWMHVADGELVIDAPKGELTEKLLDEIKACKDTLVQYLTGYNRHTDSPFDEIVPVLKAPSYPLSSAQRSIWVLSHFKNGNIAYNIPGAYVFEGDLDKQALDYAFRILIERHECLRTIFQEDEQGEVSQVVCQPAQIAFCIDHHDIRQEADVHEVVRRRVREAFTRAFNLATPPLISASLFQVAADKWVFIYTLHHIVGDAWSMSVMIRELLLVYNARRAGRPHVLPPLHWQYKDYAVWQQNQLRTNRLEKQKAYWKKQFEGQLPVLEWQGDKPRPAVKTYNGGIIRETVSKKAVDELTAICQSHNATLFMGLMAVNSTLLHRYTGQEDLVIGCTVAGRDHDGLEGQIGLYINTLPLRIRFSGTNTYSELLENIKQLTLAAYEHQAYPFEELVNDLGIQPNPERNPLFDVMMELRDNHNDGIDQLLERVTTGNYDKGDHVISKFDLTFFFSELPTGIELLIEYNSDIYNRATAERLGRHWKQLLTAITKDPEIPVERLAYIDEEERHKLLFDFNNTKVDYQPGANVVSLFEQQAKRVPDDVAVIFEDVVLTYRELDEASNRLANYLVATHNIRPGDLVGIMLDRSEKTVVSILGILKAGAAFVPVEPGNAAERNALILQDTGAKLLITQADYIYYLNGYHVTGLAIDIELEHAVTTPAPTGISLQSESSAYVIYTSGSTGMPKGCVVTHDNLFNYIHWANEYYFDEIDRPCFGFFTPLSFDLTITSIFCPLTKGGTLYIYSQYQDVGAILKHSFSAASSVNCIKLTPSHVSVLEHLDVDMPAMSVVILGGEEVKERHVAVLKRLDRTTKIYNEYGPTETTVGCLVAPLEEGAPVLIGKPVYNTHLYILDKNGAPCPIGIPGEIYIGGKGVARGYLNRDELTKQRFLPDPFTAGQRMYRTGDWGKWLDDGNVVFMGRRDEQVKIRGHRVELGEIESLLRKYSGIKDAAVLARQTEENDVELLAYYVVAHQQHDASYTAAAMTAFLSNGLPAYMIPVSFIAVESIPLTNNGKVDKRRLLEIAAKTTMVGAYVPPGNELETRLAEIWEEVLGKDRIGIHNTFFELGGHSLKAMKLISRINREFEISYSLDMLFNNPTIQSMAVEIEKAMHSDSIEKFTI